MPAEQPWISPWPAFVSSICAHDLTPDHINFLRHFVLRSKGQAPAVVQTNDKWTFQANVIFINQHHISVWAVNVIGGVHPAEHCNQHLGAALTSSPFHGFPAGWPHLGAMGPEQGNAVVTLLLCCPQRILSDSSNPRAPRDLSSWQGGSDPQ